MNLSLTRCMPLIISSIRSWHLEILGAATLVSLPFTQASPCDRCQKWGPFYKETREAMAQMDASMKLADDGLTGSVDADFIRLMIPHHQGAVDMAKAVLLHGIDPALRNIAQEIVAEQTIEIQYLQKLQNRLAATAAAPFPATYAPGTPPMTVRSPAAAVGSDLRLVANETPAAPPKITDYTHDRVYTCDQVSNTVSVIDPSQNRLLAACRTYPLRSVL